MEESAARLTRDGPRRSDPACRSGGSARAGDRRSDRHRSGQDEPDAQRRRSPGISARSDRYRVTITRRVDDKDAPSTIRGVRLSAVLERAGLAATDPNDWKHTIVLATASDGYRVVFLTGAL
jgi:hypothetical protein